MEWALVTGYRGLILNSCVCDGSIGEQIQSFWKGEGIVRSVADLRRTDDDACASFVPTFRLLEWGSAHSRAVISPGFDLFPGGRELLGFLPYDL